MDRPAEAPDADWAGLRPRSDGGFAPLPAGWPSHIDPYRLEGWIGEGGSAEVLAARDSRDGRPLALKRLKPLEPGADGADLRRRFLQEAALAARLLHPDLLRLHEAGLDAEGRPYLAMERIAGGDLGRALPPGQPLPLATVLHLGARIAWALDHAHRHGVIHRDLKPANLLIDPARKQLKLADFGQARLDGAELTRTGTALGSLDTQAPELLAGAPVDGRCDLYSLGATLFFMLTAQWPHAGLPLPQRLRARAGGPPPALRALRPELPEALDRLLRQTLDPNPEARPADAATLARALDALRTPAAPPAARA